MGNKKAAIIGGKDLVFMVRVLIAKCIAVFGPVENFPKEEFDSGNNTNHGKQKKQTKDDIGKHSLQSGFIEQADASAIHKSLDSPSLFH